MTRPSDFPQARFRDEAQSFTDNNERDDIIALVAANGSTRRFAEDRSQGRVTMNGVVSGPLSKSPYLPPYAETDGPERHNRFCETAEREDSFRKESERLESAISSRNPCARLFYVSVNSNTKLRLYRTLGQALVKTRSESDKALNNVSWIASDGITDPHDSEWFMLRHSTGTEIQKPLQLKCHNMGSSREASSLANDSRKNYDDVSRFLNRFSLSQWVTCLYLLVPTGIRCILRLPTRSGPE